MLGSGLIHRVAHITLAAAAVGITLGVEASAQTGGVTVTPDGTSTPQRDANTGGYSALFRVTNTGTQANTYYITCQDETPVTCTGTSLTQVTLVSGGKAFLSAYYDVGAAGTGEIRLRAFSDEFPAVDEGYFTVPVVAAGPAPVVNPDPHNPDHQDMARCAMSCFAATYAHSTVPYITMDTPRNVTLVYHGDRLNPKPFIHVRAMHGGTTGDLPQEWRLEAKLEGAAVTFVNGETVLRYNPPTNLSWYRLAGQLDAAANGATTTGAYDLQILVTAQYGGGSVTTTVNTKLLVIDEDVSAIAKGWTLAGIQRVYPDGDSALITEGDGSAVFFKRAGSSFTRPAGEFSTLYLNQPSGAAGWTRRYPDSTRVVFNSSGRMIEVRDRFNNVTAIVYDGSNRVQKVRDPTYVPLLALREITLAYDGNGLTSITDAFGRVTDVTVNGSKRLTEIKDPDNLKTAFGYDGTDRLLTITDRRGKATTLVYDSQSGKLATVTAPAVPIFGSGTVSPVTTLAAWQKVGVPYTSTASTPASLIGNWSVNGTVTDPGGHVTTVRVPTSKWGQPDRITDALGLITTFAYTSNGQVKRIDYPTGVSDTLSYNGDGLLTYSRPAVGVATNFRYAAWALVDSLWGTNQPAERRFVAGGKVDSVRVGATSSNPGRVTRFTYDSKGRVTMVKDPLQHLLTQTWYAGTNSNRSKDSIPGGRLTTFGYDTYGRNTTVAATGYATRTTTYDVLNRPLTVNDGLHPNLTYAYEDSLHLTKVTDPKGQVYKFAYNAVGWLTQRTDPQNRSDGYEYSRDGEPRRWTNRRTQAITQTYDALHRPLVRAGTGIADTLSYPDTLGRVTVAASGVSRETTYRNVRGQPDSAKTVMGGRTYWQRYTYRPNTVGLLDSVRATASAGATFLNRKYGYHLARGTLDSIRLGPGSSWTVLGRNSDLSVTGITLPGGDAVNMSYTTLHGELSISTQEGYNPTVWRDVEYDDADRIGRHMWEWFGFRRSSKFRYDTVGRLVSDSIQDWDGGECEVDIAFGVMCFGGSWQHVSLGAYAYDSVGNRRDLGGLYQTGNRITNFDGCTYTTDNDGNVTFKNCTSTSDVRYYWRPDNLLRTYAVVNGDSVDLFYDVAGRLVRKNVNGAVARYFLWDGANLFAELDAAGAKVGEYSYYPGLDNLHAFVIGSTPYYAHRDPLGNVIALTDAAEAVQRSYLHLNAWGKAGNGTSSLPCTGCDRARYKGALYLGEEADLYYMRARWYEPKTGRFLSEDPIGLAGGINQYVFAAGDPVNRRDPTGLCSVDEELWMAYREVTVDGVVVGIAVEYYYCKAKGGGGGNGDLLGRAVTPDECPALPANWPSNIDLAHNIETAEEIGAPLPVKARVPWFEAAVNYGGPWDIKKYGDPATLQHAGNFHYGAVGRAADFFSSVLYRGAGYAHQLNQGVPKVRAWTTAFIGPYPYGDDEIDQANIRAGIQYYENGCHL
jgi:RHS repeat-associated protein